jgi:cell division protein FtsL
MNIIFQWILVIVIIAVIATIVTGSIIALYWIIQVKRVIKSIPLDIKKQIEEENKIQKEVENDRENTRRQRQRRVGNEEIAGHIGEQKLPVQSGSSDTISDIRKDA